MSNVNTLDLSRVTQDTFVDRVHFFHEVESTNTVALAHVVKSDPPLNELFIAQRQTKGRGRGSNTWWSAAGALTWSLLTRPFDVPTAQLPQASLTVGLAICKTVESLVPGDVTLKWPNDVFLNGRKLAGILIEIPPQTPQRLVIGVGLNVNNSLSDAPEEIRARATSMFDVTMTNAPPLELSTVLIAALTEMEIHLSRFAASDAALPAEWRARSLLTGRQVRFVTPRKTVAGVCRGIADDGALEVETTEGLQLCYGGVIKQFGENALP